LRLKKFNAKVAMGLIFLCVLCETLRSLRLKNFNAKVAGIQFDFAFFAFKKHFRQFLKEIGK